MFPRLHLPGVLLRRPSGLSGAEGGEDTRSPGPSPTCFVEPHTSRRTPRSPLTGEAAEAERAERLPRGHTVCTPAGPHGSSHIRLPWAPCETSISRGLLLPREPAASPQPGQSCTLIGREFVHLCGYLGRKNSREWLSKGHGLVPTPPSQALCRLSLPPLLQTLSDHPSPSAIQPSPPLPLCPKIKQLRSLFRFPIHQGNEIHMHNSFPLWTFFPAGSSRSPVPWGPRQRQKDGQQGQSGTDGPGGLAAAGSHLEPHNSLLPKGGGTPCW